jgi:predicted lipid-binding transport protein (Tim44 family)
MSDPLVEVMIWAIIAGFILLKFYKVLGTEDKDAAYKYMQNVNDIEMVDVTPRGYQEAPPINIMDANSMAKKYEKSIADSLLAINKIDDSFSDEDFVSGAKIAFEMVLSAFNNSKKSTLEKLLHSDIYKKMVATLDKRDSEESHIERTLIKIIDATIKDVVLNRNMATITVRFESEQMKVRKSRQGEDLDKPTIEIIKDEWKFERDVSSSNPDWQIAAINF